MDNKVIFAIAAALVVVVAAVAVVIVAGDNNNSNNNNQGPSDDEYYKNGVSVNNKIASTTSDNVVTLYKKPKIFTVYAQNIELLCALGCEDLIVGAYIGNRGTEPLNEKYSEAYFKVVNNEKITKEVSSNAWSKEEVMASGADLIIGW